MFRSCQMVVSIVWALRWGPSTSEVGYMWERRGGRLERAMRRKKGDRALDRSSEVGGVERCVKVDGADVT